MVIRVDVVCAALEAAYAAPIEQIREQRRVVVLTPVGQTFSEHAAVSYAEGGDFTLLCGRYEGFDQRVHDHVATEELSLGPYVLSGGELAAMVVIDAVVRRLPGALGQGGEPSQRLLSRRRWAADPSIRTTPVPSCIGVGACRRCCCRATTGGWPSGVRRSRASATKVRVADEVRVPATRF